MTERQFKRSAFVILLAAVIGCQSESGWQALSLVNLIANPEEYRGSDIFVTGYSRVSRGKLFLFLSEQHARVDDFPSAVLLDRTLGGKRMDEVPKCLDRFVTVFGRFEELPIGLDGITKIERVIAYGPNGDIDSDCFTTNRSAP